MANEPITVYMVETGCYSSASIDAVFTNREAAEIYADNCGDRDHQIIEMVLDAETLHLLPWQCVLALDSGDQLFVGQPEEKHYKPNCKSDVSRNRVSAWGQSEEHARKNAADFRMRKLTEIDREGRLAEARAARIAKQFEDMETSQFIAARNAQTGDTPEASKIDTACPPWFDLATRGTVQADNFVAPTQDQKAMMDLFYDLYVAGVKE